jgi:hypothetical protein
MGFGVMAAEVIELGAHERMSVAEALGLTLRESPSEVLIIFVDAEGELGIRSSGMANKDALWNLEVAKSMILENALDDD